MSTQSFEFEVELLGGTFEGKFRVEDGWIEELVFSDGSYFSTAAGSLGTRIQGDPWTSPETAVAQYVLRSILASEFHREQIDRTKPLVSWDAYAPVRI